MFEIEHSASESEHRFRAA